MTLTTYAQWLRTMIVGATLSFGLTLEAQKVVFPQEVQPGAAVLVSSADSYTLQNKLLKATFKKQGGSLFFGGCPELNLEEGTELFEIKTGNGSTTVKASQMTLGNIREVTYEANEKAVKGAKKFAGRAIEADFTHDNLALTWRAVLRDGSHYLRTELELTANADTKMFSVSPMIYKVNVEKAGSAPKVVGNTRGAVLLSKKIFAGLETPMGINSVGETDNVGTFNHTAWTTESFTWIPGEQVPQKILDLGFTTDKIKGTKGYLSFKQKGSQTITFTYTGGNHKLNIVGVEVCNLMTGEVVASDYHYGTTGNAHNLNTYTVDIPQKGVYEVRYYVATYTLDGNTDENINSTGNITYSGEVRLPILIYDLLPGSQPHLDSSAITVPSGKATRVLSQNTIGDGDNITDSWTTQTWRKAPQNEIPLRIGELGFGTPHVHMIEQDLTITTKGEFKAEFLYRTGNHRLNLCGVDLQNSEKQTVAYDYHLGYTGSQKDKNIYTLAVPAPGIYKLRYFVEFKNEQNTSSGNIKLSLIENDILHLAASPIVPINGLWSRNTNLLKGETWKVGSVVGLVAPDQPRRSFLAYSERERAVPWRAMPAYISWYELNIDRNNSIDYSQTMTVEQCTDVVNQWKTNLFDKYGENINSFVWDDGWDFYGPWTFNKNFPNGFSEIDVVAQKMNSGIGAWLGPVGGYGASGNYRRNYWKNQGGMQLSNPKYYKAFTKAITDLCNDRGYDFRFFKFDGISDLFSALGPKNDANGEENAEGIIRAERMVRETIKEDIFFNTTVGTWASPFWFQFTDAIWRQENDYGEIGNQGTDREKWITYRDRLVYQNFVQNSPICPINTLMTHGFILSRWGQVSKNMDYDGIVRELRCAFACGSGMVELYNDYALMNSINGGRLWGDLAECLRWQKNNADVLPDAHWVGGNPWDGSKTNVYGWASWNGSKSTLALRNPSASQATYKTTLRAALEIPAHITDSIILSKAFGTQNALTGLTEDVALDIDAPLTLVLPGSSVFVFNGRDSKIPAVEVTGVKFAHTDITLEVGKSTSLVWNILPANATHTSVTWSTDDADIATIDNGVVKAHQEGQAIITVTNTKGHTAQITVNVVPFVPEPYAVNFEKDARPQRSDRSLQSVSITQEGKEKQTILTNADRMPYQDHTNQPIEVEVGSILTPELSWNGSWMHAYLFMDLDNDGHFEVEDATSYEVLSFNYYEGQKKGKDGLSGQSNNNPGIGVLPKIQAPLKPGMYRTRFKVDWNNIDPAGQVGGGNDILKNGGSITDVMLKVVAPSSVEGAALHSSPVVQYDLSGRIVNGSSAHGVYIVNGKKVVK